MPDDWEDNLESFDEEKAEDDTEDDGREEDADDDTEDDGREEDADDDKTLENGKRSKNESVPDDSKAEENDEFSCEKSIVCEDEESVREGRCIVESTG